MKGIVEWSYKTPKGLETRFVSEEMAIAHAYILIEDIEKLNRAKNIQFLDEHDTYWTKKEMKKYLQELETEPHNIRVHFDGGYDIENNLAGLGCVIHFEKDNKKYRIRKNAVAHDLKNNNEAEYAALYLSVQELEQLQVNNQEIQIYGDSQTVINQMSEEWALTETNLLNWANDIDAKLQAIGLTATYTLVDRNDNAEADKLATQALNGVDIIAKQEKL